MSAMPLFRGAGTALITPFKNGEVDFDALRGIIKNQIEGGVKALVACGTTGEPTTLTAEERVAVIRTAVEEANGSVPVICGTGSNNTRAVIETERKYRDLGCAAQLVVTPYYNKTTQEGLYAHFMAIAEATELPIVIYNVPSRTGLDISPEVLARLCESEHFIAIKESSYDVPYVMQKLAAVGDKLAFYCGNDEMTYSMLALGFEGVISVVTNLRPSAMADVTKLWFDGDWKASRDAQLKLLPLCRALFKETSPIPVKYAAEYLGICGGEVRLPLIGASEPVRELVRKALEIC